MYIVLTQTHFVAGASLVQRRSARGIFATRCPIDPFDRRSTQPQPISIFLCSGSWSRTYEGAPTAIAWAGHLVCQAGFTFLGSTDLGCTSVRSHPGQDLNRHLLHTNVNHSAYCGPLGRTSSGCTVDPQVASQHVNAHSIHSSRPLRSSLQHHLGNCQQQV
jgi:hypothetical protein